MAQAKSTKAKSASTKRTTAKTKAVTETPSSSESDARAAIEGTVEKMDATAAENEGGADGDPTTGAGAEYYGLRQERRHSGMSSERANELERREKAKRSKS